MSSAGAALVLSLAGSALAGAALSADEPLAVHLRSASADVELGKAFPVTVVRRWERDLLPERWDDAALAPLVVRRVATSLRETDDHLEETLRFDGYAFERGEVTVPAPTFRAVTEDGRREQTATGEALVLRVRPALESEEAGPPELPGDPFPEPLLASRWWVRAAAAVVTLALVLGYARRRSRRAGAGAVPRTPRARALQRLAALRSSRLEGREELDAWYVEASALVRIYLWEQFALHAPEMSTEQLLADPETARVLGAGPREQLAGLLALCDHVKFALHSPGSSAREALLRSAESLVRNTAPGHWNHPRSAGAAEVRDREADGEIGPP